MVFNTAELLKRFADEEFIRKQREQLLAQERRNQALEIQNRLEVSWRTLTSAADPREQHQRLRQAFSEKRAAEECSASLVSSPTPSAQLVYLADPPAWAVQVKRNGSFFCYAFKDGSYWVLYPMQSGKHVLRQWPSSEEGWDEALPSSLGQAQTELGCYLVADHAAFCMAVRNYTSGMSNTSNPAEIQHLFDALGFSRSSTSI